MSPAFDIKAPLTQFQMVQEFHDKFGLSTLRPTLPAVLPQDVLYFRLRFLQEELQETNKASLDGDLEMFVDGLVDLRYVLLGTLDMMGVPYDAIERGRFIAQATASALDHLRETAAATLPRAPSIPCRTLVDACLNVVGGNSIGAFLAEQLRGNIAMSTSALAMLNGIIEHLAALGCVPLADCFWEVHQANMRKERVLHAGESKRGSAFDIKKPVGWQGPNLKPLLGIGSTSTLA